MVHMRFWPGSESKSGMKMIGRALRRLSHSIARSGLRTPTSLAAESQPGLPIEWNCIWQKRLSKQVNDVIAATALGDYRLHLVFEGGVEGDLDLARWLNFRGVFGPLQDPDYFAQVRVDSNIGTVIWPNGVDNDPDVLYERVKQA
jgi:hypothetical protein